MTYPLAFPTAVTSLQLSADIQASSIGEWPEYYNVTKTDFVFCMISSSGVIYPKGYYLVVGY